MDTLEIDMHAAIFKGYRSYTPNSLHEMFNFKSVVCILILLI